MKGEFHRFRIVRSGLLEKLKAAAFLLGVLAVAVPVAIALTFTAAVIIGAILMPTIALVCWAISSDGRLCEAIRDDSGEWPDKADVREVRDELRLIRERLDRLEGLDR